MNKNILKGLSVLMPFTEDIHRKVHGRGLVRELDYSQRAIQNRLNHLEEEGILKSEVSGRTKEFSLDQGKRINQKNNNDGRNREVLRSSLLKL